MTEEVQMAYDEAQDSMENSLQHLSSELAKIRAGKATPSMMDGVFVDYYGTRTPLNQVANVSTPDPKTIRIQPWEKTMLEPIEKAITNANLGLNPQNTGEVIMINVPPLTEERRINLVKKAKEEAENAKISIRTARKEANDLIKQAMKEGLAEDVAKDAEAKIQDLTNSYTEKVETLFAAKEKDIMTV